VEDIGGFHGGATGVLGGRGQNKQSEQKLRELSAFNAPFQKHLDLRCQKHDELRELVDAKYKVGEEAQESMLRATQLLRFGIDRESEEAL
jgi:hypothetical protein